MARALNGRSGRPTTTRKTASKTRAERQMRTAKVSLLDVYEHQQRKVRRDKVQLTLGNDEASEFRRDDTDDEQPERDALRARLIGENIDNERVDSEDDEEIDSDAAFESGDDEQYAGFTFGKQVSRRCIFL